MFGGNIYVQNDGGAIGSDLTGEIARLVMAVWDTKFLKILKNTGIYIDMYKRYVDDQIDTLPPITPGWRYSTAMKRMVNTKETLRALLYI